VLGAALGLGGGGSQKWSDVFNPDGTKKGTTPVAGSSGGTVKRFAEGAVVKKPTLAWIGETAKAQPEIVSPAALMRSVVGEAVGRAIGPALVANRFAVPSYPTMQPVARQPLARVAPAPVDARSGAGTAPLHVENNQEYHFHGGDLPTVEQIDVLNRKMAMRVGLLAAR
jgi:hypothetical protein